MYRFKLTGFTAADTQAQKKRRKTEAALHPYFVVLGKPMTKDIVIQQSHAIA